MELYRIKCGDIHNAPGTRKLDTSHAIDDVAKRTTLITNTLTGLTHAKA